MKYYKNKKEELFFEPSEAVIKKHELTKITKKEFDKILEIQNTLSEEDLKSQRISELLAYLSRTDHKDLPSYKPKPDEDLKLILAERDAARDEIRSLK